MKGDTLEVLGPLGNGFPLKRRKENGYSSWAAASVFRPG